MAAPRPYEVVRVPGPRTPEWYAARRQSIGSSEAASVLGFGKWAHPLGVWLDKTEPIKHQDYDKRTGRPHSEQSRALMNAGHSFEEAIARAWAAQTGQRIIRPPAVIRSRRYPWMAASLDWAVAAGPRSRTPIAPVECKLVAQGWEDWRNDDGDLAVPPYYIAQVWHQLVVLDQPVGHVAAFIGGRVESFQVEADDDLRAEVAERQREWWERHVVGGEPPPLDPIPDRALLDRAVPRPLRKAVDLSSDPDVRQLLRDLADAREAARTSKRDAADLTNRLCALMHDAELAVVDGAVVATWKPDSNGTRKFIPKPLPASPAPTIGAAA